jgi:DNA-binding HxlR family transcriptional regulator
MDASDEEEAKLGIPVPGKPVRGSRSGAPIMALFDLLGRRWAMGILWTLSEGGPLAFSALQDRCETISPTVLSQRLRELQSAGFVAKTGDGYAVTPLGGRVYERLVPLGAAAREWAKDLSTRQAR